MEARSPSSQGLQNVGQWEKTTPENTNLGPPWWLSQKESARNVGEAAEAVGSIPGWQDSLEKGMAIHSSILAWRIQHTGGPGGLQGMGSQSQT